MQNIDICGYPSEVTCIRSFLFSGRTTNGLLSQSFFILVLYESFVLWCLAMVRPFCSAHLEAFYLRNLQLIETI